MHRIVLKRKDITQLQSDKFIPLESEFPILLMGEVETAIKLAKSDISGVNYRREIVGFPLGTEGFTQSIRSEQNTLISEHKEQSMLVGRLNSFERIRSRFATKKS